MNLDPIKIAVFDMAGTTIDEGYMVYQAVSTSLAELDIHVSTDSVFNQIGGMNKVEGIRLLIERDGKGYTDQDVKKVVEIFMRTLKEKYSQPGAVSEMEGASLLFRQLKTFDIKVALDTGYTRQIAEMLLAAMDWKDQGLVDFLVASEEVETGRPAPLMIQKIMQHFDVNDPGNLMKVGDTKADIQEGINAGCKYIVGITSPSHGAQELLACGATHVVSNLKELHESIEVHIR